MKTTLRYQFKPNGFVKTNTTPPNAGKMGTPGTLIE